MKNKRSEALFNAVDENESFLNYIRNLFIEKSGIENVLTETLDFCSALEFSEGGDISEGIAPRLGWTEGEWKRFTHSARHNFEAAFFKNEDGSDWQAIVSIPSDTRPYQYFAPKGVGDIPYLPPIPFKIRKKIADRFHLEIGGETGIPTESSFWEWLEKADIPIVLTEGGKKALALLSLGIPAIALYGISCGCTKAGLKPIISRFVKNGKLIILAMDNDANSSSKTARKRNYHSLRRLSEAIKKTGGIPQTMKWKADFKGVDDLIISGNFEDYWIESLYYSKKTKVQQMMLNLDSRFGSRLKLNEMDQKIYLDQTPIDLNTAQIFWNDHFSEDASTEKIMQCLIAYSSKHKYHPVKLFLEKISKEEVPNTNELESIASTYLGCDDDLSDLLMKKTLIGAVARVFNPGCKLDTCTILQGDQGIGKSTFWKALAFNPDWFDDNFIASSSSEKDEKLKISRFWFLELAELESIYKKKDVSSVRSLLSTSIDSMRPPYGKDVQQFPRHSIFVGTINPDEFLRDSEGNRRFWCISAKNIVLPSPKKVIQLWKEAIQAFKQGEQWWLTPEEEKILKRKNKQFETSDPWESLILDYARHHEYISIPEMLLTVLDIEPARQTRAEHLRVSDILKKEGYIRMVKRVGTKTIKSWKLAENIENDGNDGNTAKDGSNPLPEPVSTSDLNNHLDNDGNKTVTSKTPNIQGFQPLCYRVTVVSQEIEKKMEEEKTEVQIEMGEKVEEKFAKNNGNDGNTVTSSPKPLLDKTSNVTVSVTDDSNIKQNNGNIPPFLINRMDLPLLKKGQTAQIYINKEKKWEIAQFVEDEILIAPQIVNGKTSPLQLITGMKFLLKDQQQISIKQKKHIRC